MNSEYERKFCICPSVKHFLVFGPHCTQYILYVPVNLLVISLKRLAEAVIVSPCCDRRDLLLHTTKYSSKTSRGRRLE